MISADRLSPDQGAYKFAQQMLRQVAYDTMSRPDRKGRHLAVAAHLRATFPGDGEEMADVIARHYLDAVDAVADDPDTPLIRAEAVAALIRSGERAERTGASARAATAFATAAGILSDHTEDDLPARASELSGDHGGQPAAHSGPLWERAADAATANGDWPAAAEYADHARDHHLGQDDRRAAARAQVIKGGALRMWGHFADARLELAAALQVLESEPDDDTVRALDHLAVLEVYAGSSEAEPLTNEALRLGQALGVDTGRLVGLFTVRAICLVFCGRRAESNAYFREAAQLAEQSGDYKRLGRVLVNLSDSLGITDPAAAAEAARTAVRHLRRAGDRPLLSGAHENLAQALLLLGDWDGVANVYTEAAERDGLADIEYLTCYRVWLAALRGDAETARATLDGLDDMRVSEDLQDVAVIAVVEAFTAAAHGDFSGALGQAQHALAHADALNLSFEALRWAWPLAARCAADLHDRAAVDELLALLDNQPPGHLVPLLRAERDLVRARLTGQENDAQAGAAFVAAVAGQREASTPYHLAHGLFDHAEYLVRHGAAEAAADAVAEARDIGIRLRCQPLLDRAERLAPATPTAPASRLAPGAVSAT
jgi:tetratricopeptide (TPR) repeat protein